MREATYKAVVFVVWIYDDYRSKALNQPRGSKEGRFGIAYEDSAPSRPSGPGRAIGSTYSV